MDNKKYRRWSKETKSDEITQRIEVEEVTNGFVITYTKYGPYGKENEVGHKEWKDECIKKISTINPFESDKDEDKDVDFDINSINKIDLF